MPKDISQLPRDIQRLTDMITKQLIPLLLEKAELVAKETVENEIQQARSKRSPEAEARRPGTGYDKLIEVAKKSIERMPDALGIGRKNVLNSFTNPRGEPLWRFFEYGTYKKEISWGFWPKEGFGMYKEGISVPTSKGVRPHPPMQGIFFLNLAFQKAQKEIKSRFPAEIRNLLNVGV